MTFLLLIRASTSTSTSTTATPTPSTPSTPSTRSTKRTTSTPTTTPPSNKRKKAANAANDTNKPAKKKKLSKEESKVVCDAYNYHGGDWQKIMRDPKVKQLDRAQSQLSNHIQYKKGKKNKEITSQKGSEERDRILENITDASENGVDDYEDVADTFCASDADSENDLPTEEPTTPPLSPSLSPSSQSIREYDKDNLMIL